MKQLFIALLFLMTAGIILPPAVAQNKKLDPYSVTTNASLYPKSIRIASWIPGTTEFAYSKDMISLQKIILPSNKTETILNVDHLNAAIAPYVADLGSSGSEMRRLPNPEWKDKNTFLFQHANMYFEYSVPEKKAVKINSWPAEAESTDFCAKNNIMAYTKGKNLYISVKDKEIAVTSETDPNIKMCNYVHREEFGITKGTFWSPEGTYLAFYRMDESDVTSYPIVDVTARVAELVPEKYPMAGMNSHYVTLGVYNIKTGTTVFMKTGEPREQYLTSVTWSPDEQYIFIGLLNRDQNHLKLNMYEATTGKFVKTLFEEQSDVYVEPLYPLYFLPGSNTEFLWMSQRDGNWHLYHYDTSGELIKQLTKGAWVVTEVLGFDTKGSQVFIHATLESPIEQHIYSVKLKTGAMKKVSSQPGTHYGDFSDDGKYCFDSYSSLTITSQAEIVDASGKTIAILLENTDPLKNYSMPTTEIFTIKNSEGTDLYCRMIKPASFDPAIKYPVIVYVYGGPHAQLVTNSWLGGSGLFLNYLAQEGFLVFTLDNRGSSNRGFEFETAIFHNLGSAEVEDQMEGIKYLKTLPYVDSERIGVHGWSYGGFMTISLMLKQPDVFKVGVAGAPVCDWKYYEVMYGERYMGTPENNPHGYKQSGLLDKAKNLKGRLLIIHGSVDPVVVWQHSLMFLESSIAAKKQVDYFVYPTEEHNVGWGNRGHLYEKIYRYFKDFL